jgi:hypothetical protein
MDGLPGRVVVEALSVGVGDGDTGVGTVGDELLPARGDAFDALAECWADPQALRPSRSAVAPATAAMMGRAVVTFQILCGWAVW